MDFIYNLVKDFPELLEDAYKTEIPFLKKGFKRIAIFGRGGSYISGMLLKTFLGKELKIPLEVSPNFEGFVDSKTLIILISHSGNTKEVLHIFEKYKKYRHNFLILTSGGKLLEIAEKNNLKLVRLPPYLHERFTFCYCFFPLIKTAEKLGIIKSQKQVVNNMVKFLLKEQESLEREAVKVCEKINNKTPLFYSTEYFYPAAYRMQTSIEEDAKIICHSNKLTELFHNEFEALPSKNFFAFLITDGKELRGFEDQMKFFKKHLINFYEFGYHEYSREVRIMFLFQFTDFLGYYLSKLKGKKMGETPLSDRIKRL